MENSDLQIYSIQKKDYIDERISRENKDIYNEDVISLKTEINNRCMEVYERRKQINGIGIVYSEGKFLSLLDEAYKSFLLGFYQATIALCSITAERICYEYLEKSNIQINNQEISEEAKQYFFHIPYSRLLEFLLREKIIDERSKSLLSSINDIRNRYVHPKMTHNAKDDSLKIINELCSVVESLLKLHSREDQHSEYRKQVMKLMKSP